jgi:mannosylglucosylglycerate synthase
MQRIGILHYSAAPRVGGVESVISAHARLLSEAGYRTTVLAGVGQQKAMPADAQLVCLPELDSLHPEIRKLSVELERGSLPADFMRVVQRLEQSLLPRVRELDLLIVHNVFTKHFNLPLTAALAHLLDNRRIAGCIAWCHDLTWMSPRSRSRVHAGYPWDLLRTYRSDMRYVAVSEKRRQEMLQMFEKPSARIEVVHNGVESGELLGLSAAGSALIGRMKLWQADVILLAPVRVTQAKNLELALRVVAELKSRGVRPKFVVTGPPDPHDAASRGYFEDLLALRSRLGLEDEFHFVFESGPRSHEAYMIDEGLVAELLRVSDALFMPSHREGFGMPVLEAGLVGVRVFCADTIPAAHELASDEVVTFSPAADAGQLAELVLQTLNADPKYCLRRRVRQEFDWHMVFEREILPLLAESVHEA